jgi:hypothetical protein
LLEVDQTAHYDDRHPWSQYGQRLAEGVAENTSFMHVLNPSVNTQVTSHGKNRSVFPSVEFVQ